MAGKLDPNQTAVRMPLASVGPAQPATSSNTICQGWLLKKRRKKMQGFARRYFTLQQSGLLSYSFHPGQPTRDQILLTQAAISTALGRRDIHVDSSNATFHIKCLSMADFHMWMAAFRKFLVVDHAIASQGRRSVSKSMSRLALSTRSGVLIEELGNTITELESAFNLMLEDAPKRVPSASSRHKTDKDKNKDHGSVLGLFKKSAPHQQEPSYTSQSDRRFSSTSREVPASWLRGRAALESLRYQYSALVKSLPVVGSVDVGLSASLTQSLPSTVEETDDDDTDTPSTYKSASQSTKRTSAISSEDESVDWFDAPEGAEEFILEPSSKDDDLEPQSPEADSRNISRTDSSSLSDTESHLLVDSQSSADAEDTERTLDTIDNTPVIRRTELPSPATGDEGSILSVLRKNVGKDLSRIALPVTFNEPLTLLQKIAEELEYYDLLTAAAQVKDPVDRISYVAAFAVSTYANTRHRSSRKGFNPMLGETFEDARMKFVAEKVSHNPVILAFHAEGEGWELYATTSGKTKFWGKSLEIIPQGTIHLKLGNDHFQWSRPSSFMRNLMLGPKYLEHCGQMIIENISNDLRCTLDFKEGGYWSPSNAVSGVIVGRSGLPQAVLEGKWDEQMTRKLDASHLQVLWRMKPFPKNCPDYYGFTSFGITLNEVTPDLEGRLPPTDSRLRTDVKALEEGNLDLAESEKQRIEEAQRDRRKHDAEAQPRWFRKVGEEWLYTGGYWEQRAQGWKDIDSLW